MVIQVGLAFLSGEKEVDYTWVLAKLRDIMDQNTIEEPLSIVTDRELALITCVYSQFSVSKHLLCRWHVNMNILAKTKQFFPSPIKVNNQIVHHPQFQEFLSSWNVLLASPSKSIYNKKLQEMQQKYPTRAMKYCIDTWLIWKESLVACWINQFPHFGVTVTSPIEGCHATLKTYLQRGHSDLRTVFNRMKLFWIHQQTKIQSTIAQQKLRPKHSTNIPLFAAIQQYIHGYALQKILEELAKLPAKGVCPSSICTCSIQQSIGLPCYHTIWQRKTTQGGGMIQLSDIHPHWYYSRPDPMPSSQSSISYPLPILDPLPVQGKGRPRGALGLQGRVTPSNTRRDPSAFELPSSFAPPDQPTTGRLYVVDSGLTRLQNGYADTYEPGTQEGRAFFQGLSSIYQTESIVDTATATAALMESTIEVDLPPEDVPEDAPKDVPEDVTEEELNWELDSEEEELEALELKRQESTDWRSIPYKYLVYNTNDFTPIHPEELNALGKKQVFDAILNQDGYLYHGQQEPRSKRRDQYQRAGEQLLLEEARKAVTQVEIPPLSPLPIRRKRTSSKKQQQLDKEAEEKRQDQHQKEQQRRLEAQKYIQLERAERIREEEGNQVLDRFRKRFG
jgi:MULE transposase domain